MNFSRGTLEAYCVSLSDICVTYFATFQVPSVFAICKIQMMKRLKTDNEYILGASKNFAICWLFWTSAVNDYDGFDSDDANYNDGGDDNDVESYESFKWIKIVSKKTF